MLADIPMPDTVIFGQTVNRRLLATQLRFTPLDFGRSFLSIHVPMLHFQSQTVVTEWEDMEGNPQTDTAVLEPLFTDPRFVGKNGLLHYRLDVTDSYLVDVTTGRAPEPDSQNPTMGEFSYLRAALVNTTLETLLMFYLNRLVAENAFDDGRYSIEP